MTETSAPGTTGTLPPLRPLPLIELAPQAFAAVHALHAAVEEAATTAGLEPLLLELVRLRCSQLNGCTYCVDLHTAAARKAGETDERLGLLAAWRESGPLFTPREYAALALAEAVTRLPDHAEGARAQREARAELSDPEAAFVAWAATVVNAYNRIAVTSRPVPAAEG
ncbi:carboxymuconolactone decarboxylase family protein [Kitasatospora sp. CB01950]|uniref:carboxymuconolactone decarboxylase family protein n=1 Tax=Kitasatospora sp. CB01950 TaxID=1703930 RepID=UPI001F51CDC3|nr:carboxymuconolactone decarboxylase family protein [Kitasatospora sp. CB01950]